MTTTTIKITAADVAADWYEEQGDGKAAKFLRGEMELLDEVKFVSPDLHLEWLNRVRFVWNNRRDRIQDPDGEFDSAGRWYPSDWEDADGYTSHIRSPSRTWPYSYVKAARSRSHVTALATLALQESARLPHDMSAFEQIGQRWRKERRLVRRRLLDRFRRHCNG